MCAPHQGQRYPVPVVEVGISDLERDAAIRRLQRFSAGGRLDEQEYQERLADVRAAATRADLTALFADLPGGVPAPAARPVSWVEPKLAAISAATYRHNRARLAPPPPMPQQQHGVVPQLAQKAEGKPWYAQWWVVVVAVFISLALSENFWLLAGVAALWVWVIYPKVSRKFVTKDEVTEMPAERPGTPGIGQYRGDNPPADYTIKGNANSRKYHTKSSPAYSTTKAEVWFNSVEAAEAAGYVRAFSKAKKN